MRGAFLGYLQQRQCSSRLALKSFPVAQGPDRAGQFHFAYMYTPHINF